MLYKSLSYVKRLLLNLFYFIFLRGLINLVNNKLLKVNPLLKVDVDFLDDLAEDLPERILRLLPNPLLLSKLNFLNPVLLVYWITFKIETSSYFFEKSMLIIAFYLNFFMNFL
jgi:hypothetical protein